MNTRDTFLQLVRKALDHSCHVNFPKDADWSSVLNFAYEQGMLGVCLEAIEALPDRVIPQPVLLEWIGYSEIQRDQYERAWNVACKLDRLWSAEGIQATVLKGRSIAQYYPVPSHRFSCDLDVFIEEGWEQACELLAKQGIRLEYEVYKEAEFTLDGVYVECHRFITPMRGNKHLQKVEQCLRALLDCEPKAYYDGTTLACPPLMFNAILSIEHSLGDFLQGKLTLKHVVDWVLLRRQDFNRQVFMSQCKEFKFDRFQSLLDALADVVEGKASYESLSPSYREVLDEILQGKVPSKSQSWFCKRVNLFFAIIRNGKKFSKYGYTSMPSFLFNSVWSHFFDKEVSGVFSPPGGGLVQS